MSVILTKQNSTPTQWNTISFNLHLKTQKIVACQTSQGFLHQITLGIWQDNLRPFYFCPAYSGLPQKWCQKWRLFFSDFCVYDIAGRIITIYERTLLDRLQLFVFMFNINNFSVSLSALTISRFHFSTDNLIFSFNI